MTVPKKDGDHFITWNASPENAKAFVYEADVILQDEGSRSAALLFGVKNVENPGASTWHAANFDKLAESNKARVFRVEPDADLQEWVVNGGDWTGLNFEASLHLRLQVSDKAHSTMQSPTPAQPWAADTKCPEV